MKQIPKSFLIHEITRMTVLKKDKWGKEEVVDSQKVKRVRIEPSSKIVRSKNGAEIQLQAELIYDCKNSRPKDIVLREDDIVVFNGVKHKVVAVTPLYDERKLHHYEIGLVKDA